MWYYKILMAVFAGTIIGQIIRVKVILTRRRREERMKPWEKYTELFLTHELGYESLKRNLKNRAKKERDRSWEHTKAIQNLVYGDIKGKTEGE